MIPRFAIFMTWRGWLTSLQTFTCSSAPLSLRDLTDPREMDLNTAYACLAGTAKHCGSRFTSGSHLRDAVAMMQIIAGGEAALRAWPFLCVSTCFNSAAAEIRRERARSDQGGGGKRTAAEACLGGACRRGGAADGRGAVRPCLSEPAFSRTPGSVRRAALRQRARQRTAEMLAMPLPDHIPRDVDAAIRASFPIRFNPIYD